ncbi:MAG: Na/Pi cotransporter family protein [Clostridia bacterium]|nr:Na/Pi cotransporter family protein [Clostridia bacterium]
MNEAVQTIFGLLGGLALFLFGMNMMSEGLQKAAGEKMRHILSMLTKNPLLGVMAGALVTAVLQSSSATTVMVIGFVSAGLMTLPQAISVIMGANIGTTMTAQLLAFKISDYIWPIVFIGFMFYFLSKNERIKNIGQTVFSFGLLFVGIETMGSVMKPLAGSPIFTNLFEQVSRIPILGVLTGLVMTLVVQSSSATIAVLQNFASQAGPDGVSSVLGLAGAIPILLGDNIGTTITALLASIGQSKDAKRTAVAHSVFNITGSFLFIWLIPWFAKLVEWISPKGPELTVISRQIANAHTVFNISCTILWLPLIAVLVKIVNFIVRGTEQKEIAQSASKYLDYKMIPQPVFSINMLKQELQDICQNMKGVFFDLKDAIDQNSVTSLIEVKEECQIIEKRNDEVRQYIAAMFAAGTLTENQAVYVSDLMLLMENIEHIEKRCMEINSFVCQKIEKGYQYSQEALDDFQKNLEMVSQMYQIVLDSLYGNKEHSFEELEEYRMKLQKMRDKARKNHKKRVKEAKCNKEHAVLFGRMLLSLEWITHDCFNMMEQGLEHSPYDETETSYAS